ncbi:MAG: substrate-binding domain-containing protein [Pirellulales bacterium]
MQRSTWGLIVSLPAAIVLIALLAGFGQRPNSIIPPSSSDDSGREAKTSEEPLLVYCAASNRAVIEAIRTAYEQETGRRVDVQYGASQTLLSSLEVSGVGDLYLPADDSFIEIARSKQLIAEVLPLASMHLVVATKKNNPKQIHSFQDLLRSDVRFVQADPDAAAVGKVTRRLLSGDQSWEKLKSNTATFRATVNEAANDVVVDAADAAIVYDAVLQTYPDLTSVELPELAGGVSRVKIGVTAASRRPTEALHFARYAAARDRGLKSYVDLGFQVEKGDRWSDAPELSIFAGSMLRPAIEETITAFEQREGVHVNRVYNGCGILVAQMKAGEHPDAYFACDSEFMKALPDLFPSPVDVSQNELVILVQKGNPHKIASLKDLAKPGLRVGVGHEKQCAMGWLTQNTLKEGGVQSEVMSNVTVQTPTGDMLVNQMQTGSLDAAVAYLSNAAGAGDSLDAIRITGLQCAVAVQPYAVAVDAAHPQLADRLLRRIRSAESKEAFLAEGFSWKADAPVP